MRLGLRFIWAKLERFSAFRGWPENCLTSRPMVTHASSGIRWTFRWHCP